MIAGVTWAISGALAAIAAVLAGLDRAIDPLIGWNYQISIFAAAILGGLGTVWGPLVGGLVMTQISEALWARFPQIYLMIFGGLLVVLLIALPRGIVPALAARFARKGST